MLETVQVINIVMSGVEFLFYLLTLGCPLSLNTLQNMPQNVSRSEREEMRANTRRT